MTNTQPVIKAGDIIGFSGSGLDGFIINLCTYGIPFWSASHVGIIGEYEGELLLFESTTLSDVPCVIQGKPFKGSQAVQLPDRIAVYPGRMWHYPLCEQLSDTKAERLSKFLVEHVGIFYDFIGAVRAGGAAWSWFESLLHDEDLGHIFCSELCAAAHRAIGLIQTDNVSRWNPNRFIRYECRERILAKPWRLK